jgi:Protein of unknown function (DUF2695)
MTDTELAMSLREIVTKHYPNVLVEVKSFPGDKSKRAVYFTDERLRGLYPLQRYHILLHLIPQDFFDEHLNNAIWYECAPGEDPNSLQLPDEVLIKSITKPVLGVLNNCGFFKLLDERMSQTADAQNGVVCTGDFTLAKQVLTDCGRPLSDFFDIFHVLMLQGAYCDCEILYNVAKESNLRSQYWQERGHGG